MSLQIAVDEAGVVCLVGDKAPTVWNGKELAVVVLSKEQAAAYEALPPDRGGTKFVGGSFVATPAVVVESPKQLTLADVISVLSLEQKAALDVLMAGK